MYLVCVGWLDSGHFNFGCALMVRPFIFHEESSSDALLKVLWVSFGLLMPGVETQEEVSSAHISRKQHTKWSRSDFELQKTTEFTHVSCLQYEVVGLWVCYCCVITNNFHPGTTCKGLLPCGMCCTVYKELVNQKLPVVLLYHVFRLSKYTIHRVVWCSKEDCSLPFHLTNSIETSNCRSSF